MQPSVARMFTDAAEDWIGDTFEELDQNIARSKNHFILENWQYTWGINLKKCQQVWTLPAAWVGDTCEESAEWIGDTFEELAQNYCQEQEPL